jgi:hypothetical protein
MHYQVEFADRLSWKESTLDSIIKVTAEKFREWGSMMGLLALRSNVVVVCDGNKPK